MKQSAFYVTWYCPSILCFYAHDWVNAQFSHADARTYASKLFPCPCEDSCVRIPNYKLQHTTEVAEVSIH